MELRDVFLRTFVRPVWMAGPPKSERWDCPACGRSVGRTSPACKGIWFTAEPAEVVALCARTHRAHDRKGHALPDDEDPVGDDAVPIVAVDPGSSPGAPPRSFVALFPPHGISFVLDADADGGDRYELRRLRELAPSDLVGARAARLSGAVIGRVAVEDVRFEAGLGAVRVGDEHGLTVGHAPAGDALEQ